MNQVYIKNEKIRFQHIDYAGIVFYPRYLEMLNGIVEDFFEEILLRPFSQMHETNGIPTVDLKIQFKNPARLGEILTKHLWITKIGKSSIICNFKFTNEVQKVNLEGEFTLVNISFSNEKNSITSEPFSPEMILKMQPYLKT